MRFLIYIETRPEIIYQCQLFDSFNNKKTQTKTRKLMTIMLIRKVNNISYIRIQIQIFQLNIIMNLDIFGLIGI